MLFRSLSLGIPIVLAVAIHYIPEGVSVAMPVYFATKSKIKAFWYTLFSGLTEPLGALCGYVLLVPYLNEGTLGFILALVAGIMVFISLDELLPTAREYGEHHLAIYGLVFGMFVAAMNLYFFAVM